MQLKFLKFNWHIITKVMTFFVTLTSVFTLPKIGRRLSFWTHFASLLLNNVTNHSLNLCMSYTYFGADRPIITPQKFWEHGVIIGHLLVLFNT